METLSINQQTRENIEKIKKGYLTNLGEVCSPGSHPDAVFWVVRRADWVMVWVASPGVTYVVVAAAACDGAATYVVMTEANQPTKT